MEPNTNIESDSGALNSSNFILQAYKGKNEWWRYVLMILWVFVGWQFFGVIPLLLTAVTHASSITEFKRSAGNQFLDLGIDSNLYLTMMIASFAIGLLFIFWGIRFIHRRGFKSLLTSRTYFDWKRTFFAFSLWGIMALGLLALDYFTNPEAYIWNFKALPFFILVLVSLLLLPLQTSFEEILFRGYLMQGLAILSKNKGIALVLTSVLFGLLHIFNPEVEKLGYIILIYYIGTGLLFGMTTLLDEGLELSLGMHAANNIVAAIFITANWTVFQTDALFIDTSEPNLSIEMYIPVLVIYPIILLILNKKYKWENWGEKLLGKI